MKLSEVTAVRMTNRWPRSGMALALAAMAVGVAGCDRQDPLDEAISEARNTLVAVGGSGEGYAAVEQRRSAYRQIVSDLRAAANEDGTAGSKAAAQLLVASAHAGEADVAAGALSLTRSEVRRAMTQARSLATRHRSQELIVESLPAFDPEPRRAEVATQLDELREEIRVLESQLEAVVAEKQMIDASIAEEIAESRAQRESEAQLRREALEARPMLRAELVARANDHRRASDVRQRAAEELGLDAARLGSQIDRIEGELAAFGELVDIDVTEQQRIARIDRELREQQAQARADLRSTDNALRTVMRRIADLYAGEIGEADAEAPDVSVGVRPGFEAVTAALRSAISAASSARSALSDQAGSSIAAYRHAVAAQHLAQADLVAEMARLAEELEAAGIDTGVAPEADGWASDAQELEAATLDAVEQAASALPPGPVQEALDARARRMRGDAPADEATDVMLERGPDPGEDADTPEP